MKKLKMILPMMAFIFAIALSFATVNLSPESAYETGRVNGPNGWETIDVECGDGDELCKVKFSPSGQSYQVYEADETTPRTGSSSEPILIIRE
jgi:hypothetical protein